ncbi:YceI family protein [Pseudofulvimonas gallinarii]|jgi:polyisoprenoid-binding protein YceI|uniref:Polyisoprenoid-binding protein YceI n=1 Tax=Pseudofulvimonas gallinarii TaxID=634155 RepID=A0A4S3KX51_9GAMM|nr:YceI family protein [Pseudofulvimonas gallinarii]TCS98439.1 polyisoprenoid-binding protein YceI [Pseudofulvimonas gallinarii]THD13756.1 hypothetical protein B1808_06925 [Pseudofulvimonas gallinarii]
MIRIVAVALLLSASPTLQAAPEWFAIDPLHTRVLFFVEHARFSRSLGQFRPVQGGLWFDADDWRNSRIEICLPVSGLDMGDADWTRALQRPAFFDQRAHPEVCLVSTRVEVLDGQHGRLHGDLTIRGISRPVVFEFTVNDLRRFSLTMKRRLGVSARGQVSRHDFGMDRYRTLIGDRVEVIIELEAQVADPPDVASSGQQQEIPK